MKRKLFCLLLALSLVFSLAVSVSAAEYSQTYDQAGLLSDSQARELNAQATAISQKYGVGVYIATVDDYRDVDRDGVYEAAYTLYHDNSLGEGADRDGILLLLSMKERDFATFCYGNQGEYAFSDYALQKMEDEFLDNFRENDWYGGFADYLRYCETCIAKAAAGEPVRESPGPRILIFCVLSLVIAGTVCIVLVLQMRSVHKKTTAGTYAVGGLQLTGHQDRFTHRTETRRKIQTSSGGSSGSHAHSGGGGHGRSGKF